jgi:hypothetical protein
MTTIRRLVYHNSVTRLILTLLALVLLPCLASGKRSAPALVLPVIHEGVRYVAPNDDGRRGHIEAWDVETNKRLWDVTVFTNHIEPGLEEDVQWIFISVLSIRDKTLVVTSERGQIYQVDLNTKAVTHTDLAASQTPTAAAQANDLPEVVERVVKHGTLSTRYEISLQVKPPYLQGDFNGDGKIDVAILVKQRSTGKLGIAIVHGATDKITILGAGVSIGNGGDDFEWMDTWEIRSKGGKSAGANVPKLHGDALLVGKSEAASALIYWNGKRYVWLQQSD